MASCEHLDRFELLDPPAPPVACEDCAAEGATWVHLRQCQACGHVGCCDDSPNRHATKHAHGTHHPVIRSYEPGEDWGYCYPDDAFLEQLPARPGEAAARHYEAP
jgi:hypothetical protein